MSGEFPSEERVDRFSAEPPQLDAPPEDQRQELMEQVLEETLAAADQPSAVGEDLIRAVREVARRHPGQPLDLEPLAIELVRVVLAPRFPGLADQGESWLAMTARVAESLWEDPASRQRFESLWRRLQQGEVD